MGFNNLFLLNLPDEWKETTVYTFNGPLEDGVKQNLVMMIDNFIDKNIDFDAYVNGRIEELKQSMPEFEMLSKENSEMDSYPVKIITFKFTPAESITIYQRQSYLHINKAIYLFTASFSKKTLQTHAPVVDSIISGLLVVDKKTLETMYYE